MKTDVSHASEAPREPLPNHLDELMRFSLSEGAGNAAAIPAIEIPVEERLANLCLTCPYHGFSHSCPPHVSGPSGFRKLQRELSWAMVIRLVVPLSALFSAEKRELGRFLHELVSAIEAQSVGMGYARSKAFAGGACKSIFCHDHPACSRLSGGPCRHPANARPSMSGFGINVPELMKRCGWPSDLGNSRTATDGESMSWLAGLVLIG